MPKTKLLASTIAVALIALGAVDLFFHDLAARFVDMQPGMNLLLISVNLSMMALLLSRDLEEAFIKRQSLLLESLAARGNLCVAVHESEFYSLWAHQFLQAKENIDVTHLGPSRPNRGMNATEDTYFTNFVKMVKKTPARVRRVERITREKVKWIDEIVKALGDAPRFSLAVYEDDQIGEMPRALSVSRIDTNLAWIVAMAEQHSTHGVRDLQLLGKEAVGLLAAYFEHRLWGKSTPVIINGRVNTEAWHELMKKYQ